MYKIQEKKKNGSRLGGKSQCHEGHPTLAENDWKYKINTKRGKTHWTRSAQFIFHKKQPGKGEPTGLTPSSGIPRPPAHRSVKRLGNNKTGQTSTIKNRLQTTYMAGRKRQGVGAQELAQNDFATNQPHQREGGGRSDSRA